MITDKSGQTKESLMRVFDGLFGDLILSVKKPTAIREKDEGIGEMLDKGVTGDERAVILLPSELDTSAVFDALGRLLGERYLLVLSSFYFRGLFRKKEADELGNYLAVHHDTLRKLGGENYRKKLLAYGLKEGHLIKSPKQAIKGLRSNEYMLNRELFKLKNQQRYFLTSKAAIRIYGSHPSDRKDAFIRQGDVYRKIASSIDGLRFDYAAAMKFVSGLPDGEGKAHRKNVVESLMLDGSVWSLDRQGRNYTILVVVPRNIRQFFSYGSEPLYSLDIRSSQPLLHVLLYTSDCPEKTRYQSIVEGGKFWEFMNQAAGNAYDLSDEAEKREMKKTVFKEVFYREKERTQPAKGAMANAFKREFPILWGELNAVKVRGRKGLPKEMQSYEAELVREAVDLLKGSQYSLITIHDCIVTTRAGVADVRFALKHTFEKLKLCPDISDKKLTVS